MALHAKFKPGEMHAPLDPLSRARHARHARKDRRRRRAQPKPTRGGGLFPLLLIGASAAVTISAAGLMVWARSVAQAPSSTVVLATGGILAPVGGQIAWLDLISGTRRDLSAVSPPSRVVEVS